MPQEQQRQSPEEKEVPQDIQAFIAAKIADIRGSEHENQFLLAGMLIMYWKMQEELRQSDVDNQRNIETAIKIEKERDNAVAQITPLQEQVKEYRDGLNEMAKGGSEVWFAKKAIELINKYKP